MCRGCGILYIHFRPLFFTKIENLKLFPLLNCISDLNLLFCFPTWCHSSKLTHFRSFLNSNHHFTQKQIQRNRQNWLQHFLWFWLRVWELNSADETIICLLNIILVVHMKQTSFEYCAEVVVFSTSISDLCSLPK